MTDFQVYLERQIAFSRASFGPGKRRESTIASIREQLAAIEDGQPPNAAWTNILILAVEGLWRNGAYPMPPIMDTPKAAENVIYSLLRQQAENEYLAEKDPRDWPDWRTD